MALPEPSFIDRDPAAITAAMVAAYQAAVGRTLHPAQVERILIDLIAYRETLLRIAIQEAAKQNLVEYARFPMLDYLGELVGVARLPAQRARCRLRFFLTQAQTFAVAVPAGTRVRTKEGRQIFATELSLTIPAGEAWGETWAQGEAPGAAANGYVAGDVNELLDPIAHVNEARNTTVTAGGGEEESDDALRGRIKLAPERFAAAGSTGAYHYHTLTAHPDIVDAAILSPSPGVVNVHPLAAGGTPGPELLALVTAALTAEKVRPLTDQVNVLPPNRQTYQIDAALTLYDWANGPAITAAAENALSAYAAARRRTLGRDVVRSQIFAVANSIEGVYGTVLSAPAADLVIAAHEWADCTGISVSVAGHVEG